MKSFDGIVLVDKDPEWSSFDVVAKIRSKLSREFFELNAVKKKIKVGHTGTLDPLATGLMIVVIGAYCKRAQEFSKLDKVYEVGMRLGETSSTGDEEGIKVKGKNIDIKDEVLEATLKSFLGESMQTPPVYSAIKVNGQRAYDLARAGKEVVMQPRKVEVYSLILQDFQYPNATFTVHVSSGTYIRSLVSDIGDKLGTGAYMTSLRRVRVGSFDIADASKVEDISAHDIQELRDDC